MGLAVTATFEKQGVYFAGDTLECHVRFTNVHAAERGGSGGNAAVQSTYAAARIRRASRTQPMPRLSSGRVPLPRRTVTGASEHRPGMDDRSEYSAGSTGLPSIATRRSSRATGGPAGPPGKGRDGLGTAGYLGSTDIAAFPALGDGMPDAPDQSSRPPYAPTARATSAASQRSNNAFPRLSTSSALSATTTSFASWLPFGARQQQQQQQSGVDLALPRRPGYGSPHDDPASDGGSGNSLLGSLWRNIAGSNPSSRPGTRAGSMAEDDEHAAERLAIGFAEVSGTLALASSYIKPDQMGLLVKHRGTNFTDPVVRSPPMGGGLGGWVPTSPSSQTASRVQKSIPLLISSPAVLFSELALAPGESQTFSVRVQLPRDLAPSFRGRVACISYDLVVVAKRSMLEAPAYVVRIPFRVMAYVGKGNCPGNDGANPLTFDQPIRMPPDLIKLVYEESVPVSTPRNGSPLLGVETGDPTLPPGQSAADEDERGAGIADMCSRLSKSTFLRQLVQAADAGQGSPVASAKPEVPHPPPKGSGIDADDEVRRNVRAKCRQRAPVEFSLSQDGGTVASIWLPRRAYQLGDMVTGKVHLYHKLDRVYQVSIWLESIETIKSQFASYDADRTEELTRRIHAEHHEFSSNTSTLGFSLASPPAAAASFSTNIVSNIWQLRIELVVGAAGSTVGNLRLSAATAFPPAKRQQNGSSLARRHMSLGVDDNLRSALRVQSPPPSLPTSPTLEAAAAPAPSSTASVRSRQSRHRSSTVVEGSAPRLGPPPDSLHLGLGARKPPAPLQSSQQPAKLCTLRRRYDTVLQVPVQTLSCTVAIQMHPTLVKALQMGRRQDSYTVDLTRRG
ncbi:Golgi membrane exchange factor (Ric1p-Rgp1p) subunit [Coemansia sp. RSA 552]|nr:Golgi membrane exchange factor (Ric1p-Rgp1p) subunit [Coemansia sp. RSA 552]